MKLQGVFEYSIDNIPTIRGYATFEQLITTSLSSIDYQRDLMVDHVKDIEEFIEHGTNKFFPEIILAYTMEYDFNKPGALSGLNPLAHILDGNEFKSNVNGIAIKKLASRYKDDSLKIFNITIPDKEIKPFKRVDGNHRLSAVEMSSNYSKYKTYKVPFCLILLNSSIDDLKREKVIFHNINSKARPLTTEQQLEGIFKNHDFSDDELKDNFGMEYVLSKKYNERYESSDFVNINRCFLYRRTAMLRVFSFLMKEVGEYDESLIGTIYKHIGQINFTYFDNDKLRECCNTELLIAYLHYLVKQKPSELDIFHKWVLANHIYEIDKISADNMIKIFDNVLMSKRRQIFVSMQFCPETREHFDAIKKVVEEINEGYKLDAKINPIRIDQFNKGYSYVINDEILEQLNQSGLLIADLTYGNKNVYHEVGFMMGLSRAHGEKIKNCIFIVRDIDGKDTDKEIGFNLKSWQQLRFKNIFDMQKELKQLILKYYEL